MKKNTSLWRSLLCLVVMLAMVLSITGCFGNSDASTNAQSNSTTSSSTASQTTQSTSATSSTVNKNNPTLELEYVLTQEDVDEFYRLLDEMEAVAIAGVDIDAIDATSEAVDEMYEFLDAQCSIAAIFHYSHTLNEEYEKQYLDCVEICTQASDAYIQMVRRVYLSDTPAKDYLFEDWTEEDIASLMAYDEQISLLQQRNAEIAVEYRTTDEDDLKIELYIEFVGNNNEIAQYYGYDNYYTYAYRAVYDRDYDPEEVDKLREYAVTHLAGVFDQAYKNFYSSYTSMSYKNQTALEYFLYGDYDELDKDYVAMYLDSISGPMNETINTMLTEDSFFTRAYDAEEGAFTTTIGERSFCYFGPGYASPMTVLHEGGHYYASRYADLGDIPLDLAEVHSQGNEWLFAKFLEGKMPNAQYNAMLDYKLYENVATILICLMVDEFEQIVYTTDLTGFTAEDFDAIMDDVALQYFPGGNVSSKLADMHSYWRLVVVDQPVYYISYAVSAVAAISLYTVAVEDYDTALLSYQKLCEEPVLDEGFLGNITAAGLLSPFDQSFYQQLKQIILSRG